MTRRSDMGFRAALLAAAAFSGLMTGAPLVAQDLVQPSFSPSDTDPTPATLASDLPSGAPLTETAESWGDMSLDELAGLIGATFPRPVARPENFESTLTYLPRPRPRPYALREEDARHIAQFGLPPEPEATADAPSVTLAEPATLAEGQAPAAAGTVTAQAETQRDTAAPAADASVQGGAAESVLETAQAAAPSAPQTAAQPAAEPGVQAEAPSASQADAQTAPQILPHPADAPAAQVAAQAAAQPTPQPPPQTATAAETAAAGDAEAPMAPDLALELAGAAQPPVTAALPPPEPLPALHTTGFSRDTFARDRATREDIYVAAEGEAKIAAAMDLVQLLMAHLLLPEARSFHERAQGLGVQLYPELHRRWRVQSAMLDTLQGRKITQSMPEGWKDASLWAIAGKAAPGQIAGSPDLAKAIAALQHHSEPVVSRLLPELFDAALSIGDLRSADSLLRGAREATTLIEYPVYHLMMGHLALAYDMPESAFDYYATAAEGRDIFAQRARIAMADLAIERRDPRLLPALAEILSEGVNQWRYGREGLILRARLAQVAEDLGDIPLALDIMGRIRQDHPGTAEAVLAHERGALALAAFATAVEAQEIGLETYLQSMRHVESFYRLDPVWPIARSALGRAWTRAGLHEAAAAEYAALQNDLARIGAPVPPEAQRVAIPIDEAEAWLQNHGQSRARIALAREGLPKFSDLATRYSLAAIAAGVTGSIGSAADFTEPEHLFTFARSARSAGQLSAAHGAHRELFLQHQLSSRPAETLHAALIAKDLGDKDFAERSLSDLRATPMGPTGAAAEPLGTALLAPMPRLTPLSQEIADTMLARSGAAIEATQALLARPLLPPDQLTAWQAERAGAPADGSSPVSSSIE